MSANDPKTRPLSHRIQKRIENRRTNIMRIFRTRFWIRGLPFVMRSRKAGLPLATRARERELCLQSYVSRITRTENFLSQKCSVFQWPSESTNVCSSPPMSVRVRHRPSESANVRHCPLISQKTRPLSHRIEKGQDIGGHRRTWHLPPPLHSTDRQT